MVSGTRGKKKVWDEGDDKEKREREREREGGRERKGTGLHTVNMPGE
jgi:hypothetical protein